jgi:hypothetical protein
MGQGRGRREEREGVRFKPKSKNSRGLGKNEAKTHSSKGQIKNI